MRTHRATKAMAKSLRGSLAARNVLLSHGECLEIVAKQLGFADWNTLSAKLSLDSDGPDASASVLQPTKPTGTCQISPPAASEHAPEQLSCSFCGKPQNEVRGLIEGGCRNRGMLPCVFICDECVAFCAQISAETLGNAMSPRDPAMP